MIITEKQYHNLFSKVINTTNENDTMVARVLFKRSPILFEQTNYLNQELDKTIDSAVESFEYYYRCIENFIVTKEPRYRDVRTKVLSFEEALFVRNIIGIKDTEYVLDKGICVNNVRVFVLNDIDINYKIINYKHDDKDLISIFIGSKFYEDEYNFIRFIYDLAELFININIRKLGIPFNRINKEEDVIVLNSNSTPSDAIFVTLYYSGIFKSVIRNTNNSIVSNFDVIYQKERPKYCIVSKKIMQKIWKYSNLIIDNEDSDLLFDTCELVYCELTDISW